MIAAFTGTRRGMLPAQFERVTFVVSHFKPERAHHGACHGADREFHWIVSMIPREMHPSNEEQYTWARDHAAPGDVVHKIDIDPIRRNHTMVDLSGILIATPATYTERTRGSGTWATIRYARKLEKPLVIVWPDGSVKKEWGA